LQLFAKLQVFKVPNSSLDFPSLRVVLTNASQPSGETATSFYPPILRKHGSKRSSAATRRTSSTAENAKKRSVGFRQDCILGACGRAVTQDLTDKVSKNRCKSHKIPYARNARNQQSTVFVNLENGLKQKAGNRGRLCVCVCACVHAKEQAVFWFFKCLLLVVRLRAFVCALRKEQLASLWRTV
jgi:hypothetical protein